MTKRDRIKGLSLIYETAYLLCHQERGDRQWEAWKIMRGADRELFRLGAHSKTRNRKLFKEARRGQ